MSIKDNVHFPDHVNLDEFYEDYYINKIPVRKLQNKYCITPRQYRFIIRYFRDECEKNKFLYDSTNMKYIYKTPRGKYSIRKRINGVFKYFGTYNELENAINIRDELIMNDWNDNEVII